MSINEHEILMDEWLCQFREEIIQEFTRENLKSFYLENPMVMRPAVESIQEGNKLRENKHYSAAIVFYATAIELLLKSTILKPVLFGLINSQTIANLLIDQLLGQTGYERYKNLLNKLFQDIANIDLTKVYRDESRERLLLECQIIQKKRNGIIHRGEKANKEDAILANEVSVATYDYLVQKILFAIGLTVIEEGKIIPIQK